METARIQEILESLGYRILDRGNYWQSTAIFRNGDNKTALQIYKDSGVWKDYVQETHFMPFQKLLELSLGTNDPKIIKKYMKEDDINLLSNKRPQKAQVELENIYEEDGLKKLLPHFTFYQKRGVSSETLKFFKCGLATGGKMYQRMVFPIYNEYSQIHGFAGRNASASHPERPKWKHIGKKTRWVYPYYISPELFMNNVQEKGSVILVESIGDMLNLFDRGIKNVLVSFGLDISPKLICFLVSVCPKKIVLSFNNDKDKDENRGLNACLKSYLKLLNYFDPEKIKIFLPTKNDFGDMSADELDKWESRLPTILSSDQTQDVLSQINKLEKKKSLPKSLLKNKKYLNA